MKYLRYLMPLLLLSAGLVMASGDHGSDDADGHDDHGGEAPAIAVTQWTEKMELFMEYPVLSVNQAGKFIIHLTILEGFLPVREGSVRLEFYDNTGRKETVTSEKPARDGIFTPEVSLAASGPYKFTLYYQSPQISDSFSINGFSVYTDAASIPHEEESADGGEITFLKEQQWKIPFATEWALEGEIKKSTWAIGQVLPDPRNHIEIVAPVEGIIQFSAQSVPQAGTLVQRGQRLAAIAPMVGGEGWTAQRLAYEQAERDYERAKRLKEHDAIALREFERIESEYLSLRAGIEPLTNTGASGTLELTAAMSGRVIEWLCAPGQRVVAGQKLGAIADLSHVLLQANVFEADYVAMGTPTSAFVRTGSNKGGFLIAEEDLQTLDGGSVLSQSTRTIPVLLRAVNRSGELKINQSVSVELHSGGAGNSVRVPETALVVDEGVDVMYVQVEGEAFAKRIVRRGPRFGNMVAILEGINPGERIVTTGAYHVKLASTTAEIGHGHAH